MSQPLSAIEQVKAQIDPYRGGEVFARLAHGTVADLTPEDDVVLRWHGLYRHRPQEEGVFMLRLKLPGGALHAAQLATIADLAEHYGQEAVSLTTRQDIELHGLTLAALPAVFASLEAVELTTLGACGDQVRNTIACPVAGVAPDEIIDTTSLAAALTQVFRGNPAFANLPRKFKPALCGCAQHCVPTAINDLSFVATPHDRDKVGFALLAGGGLSLQPTAAQNLGVWVAPEEVVEVALHSVAIFRDYGPREHRGHARLKQVLADRGLPWFRGELEARRGRIFPSLAHPLPAPTCYDHLGVHPQREEGRVFLGIPIRAGKMTVVQLRLVGALSSRYGRGRLRLTHRQNLILLDLPQHEIAAIQTALQAEAFSLATPGWLGHVVVCTGKDYCTKALVHTKGVAVELERTLEALLPGESLTIHLSGCPNGCGQHALADIGLQGAVVKGETGREARFDMWVGGGAADAAAFGRRLMVRLRPEELAPAIVNLWERYRSESRHAQETFSAFARRVLWTETPV